MALDFGVGPGWRGPAREGPDGLPADLTVFCLAQLMILRVWPADLEENDEPNAAGENPENGEAGPEPARAKHGLPSEQADGPAPVANNGHGRVPPTARPAPCTSPSTLPMTPAGSASAQSSDGYGAANPAVDSAAGAASAGITAQAGGKPTRESAARPGMESSARAARAGFSSISSSRHGIVRS